MAKRKKSVPFDVKLIAAVIVLLGATVVAEYASVFNDGFVEADVIDVSGNTIILGRGCRAIVADTTADQARSIRLGIEKRIDVRPTTHDVFVEALGGFDVTVQEVAVTRFEDEIYYAEIVLLSGDRILKIDARPTDAMAVALRSNATVKISENVLREKGQNIC